MCRTDVTTRWLESGAAWLTGDPGEHCLVPPSTIIERMDDLGGPVGVDALAAVAERAAFAGLDRRGSTSCGGSSRLLAAEDGWIALSLPRVADAELVPAWLERVIDPLDTPEAVDRVVGDRPAAALVDRGRGLGLPVARVGETADRATGVTALRHGDAPRLERPPVVIDLSSLWAGPLCARILGRHGAAIVKVESTSRRDGARFGPPAFFDSLHVGHRSVVLDVERDRDREVLRQLVDAADVVIEASRPRALEHLGIRADAALDTGPRVWVSITGHGRDTNAVAFGDDAAAAGGLVAWTDDGTPRFAVDAVADPLTGMAAAGAALHALASGGRWLLDVSMAGVASAVAGPDALETWSSVPAADARRPQPPAVIGQASAAGADTDRVLSELGVGRR